MAGCTRADGYRDGPQVWEGPNRGWVEGIRFRHRIYRHGMFSQAHNVHVYLEGDGMPWATRQRVSSDPTPLAPLALGLMKEDPTPSIYLGRPCYHGLAVAPGCSPWLWTHGRYSEIVVASMAAALQNALGPDSQARIVLIGYSGGGVLAMLMAPRLPRVDTVVTVAANLDIDAWADHHGYSRLTGSLNPAAQPPLPGHVRQVHLTGSRDLQVPPAVAKPAVIYEPKVIALTVPDFDHRCCWEREWPRLLLALNRPAGIRAIRESRNPKSHLE